MYRNSSRKSTPKRIRLEIQEPQSEQKSALDSAEKRIDIGISSDRGRLSHIDYKDTGPGIEPEHIETGVIFDPQFSTKPDGMGLGLAIAGEGATRNGLELTALEHDGGAWFRLKPVGVDDSINGENT